MFTNVLSNDISACSIVLFVFAERLPYARRYRDIFEVVRNVVVEAISNGTHQQPRQAMAHLKGSLMPKLRAADSLSGVSVPAPPTDVLPFHLSNSSQIVTNMAGEEISLEYETTSEIYNASGQESRPVQASDMDLDIHDIGLWAEVDFVNHMGSNFTGWDSSFPG